MARLFRFECQRTWESLSATGDPKVRHCTDCRRTVHLANGLDPALELAAAGRCVALALDEPDSPRTKTVGMIAPFDDGLPSTAWLVGVAGPRLHDTVRLAPRLEIDGVQFTESCGQWTATLVDGGRVELVDGDPLMISDTRYVFKSVF